MKNVMVLLSLCFLAACGSTPDYKEAKNDQSPGYFERQLTENQYRIGFVGKNGMSESKVKDFALLRAAEVTLDKGYDWFMILGDASSQKTTERTRIEPSVRHHHVSRSCGLLGCTTTHSPASFGMSVASISESNQYKTSLEISMGKGEPKDANRVFDAKALKENLAMQLLKNEK